MTKYNLTGKNSVKKNLLIAGLVLLVVLLAASWYGYRTYQENLKPVSNSERSQIFTVPLGATAKQIADQLEEAGVIRKSWAFQWYIRNSGLRDKLQAGSYSLKPSLSTKEIVEILTKGKIETDLVTILPGKRLDEIRDKLINDGFEPEEVDAALNPELYKDHPALVDKPKDASLEGYLYPESFQRTASTKPEAIVRASLDQMQKHLTPDLRAGIVRQGLTVHEGVILASIIEKEVPDTNPDDRPRVAQVFLKRLRIGMLLQSDATSVYGAALDGADTSKPYDSIYNSYTHPGLTPTPISNVSESSLKAVANPAPTDFLYFVTGNDCVNRFSANNEEHERAKAEHGIGCKSR